MVTSAQGEAEGERVGGGYNYKTATQGIFVVLELFNILITVVDTGNYTQVIKFYRT